ncbi:MAG: flagellar biosynthetic protein FliQ [Polyangiaceae bacterium]|jgi:type III secretory pathway component EscS
MPADALVGEARTALLLALLVVAPVLAAVAAVGVVVGAIQGSTQIQDASVPHAARLFAAGAVLVMVGPWMGHEIASFASHVLGLVAHR